MKKWIALVVFMFPLLFQFLQAQENWDNYIALYENEKPGSTLVRMDCIDDAPYKDYPYVLVTGLHYETTREDGFPDDDLPKLHVFSDVLYEWVLKEFNGFFVGAFTHNGIRYEYFYLKSMDGVQKKMEKFYKKKYKGKDFYLNIKEDKNWDSYLKFLYPNEQTQCYMSDQKVVLGLMQMGDNGFEPRRVDHWMYFEDETLLENAVPILKKKGYAIEFSGKPEEKDEFFQLRFWKEQSVDINSIAPVTWALTELAKELGGWYDGWECEVVKEKD